MNRWKLIVFGVVMAVTLILLVMAIGNIRANPLSEYQIDESEALSLAGNGSLTRASAYLDEGLLRSNLTNGDFVWVENASDIDSLVAQLREGGVEIDVHQSRWVEFFRNSIPFLGLCVVWICLMAMRKTVRQRTVP